MSRYNYKKEYSWNPEIAYLAGLIAADGCLINDRRHINVTSKDDEIMEIVMSILNKNLKVSSKKNGFGGFGLQVQFSDVSLYDFLVRAGITPAKSKTIQSINVPDEFYGEFLRGLFDGDGTVYGYWDKRWKNSFMYYSAFISASDDFLEWLRVSNVRLAGTTLGKIKNGTRAKALTYAKSDSYKLFELMYKNIDGPKLTRKFDKFVDFLRLDPYSDKAIVGRVL